MMALNKPNSSSFLRTYHFPQGDQPTRSGTKLGQFEIPFFFISLTFYSTSSEGKGGKAIKMNKNLANQIELCCPGPFPLPPLLLLYVVSTHFASNDIKGNPPI